MKVFMYLDDIPDFNIGNTAVALGNFDGVHKGHT
ncbi:MAG: bifunctional riboflavin kinase/FAD synthetase, partial [Firmicutes bacterium]|nr:bifunctional riboflavin kinase/FAD synthetase [Bacillota bacterium]